MGHRWIEDDPCDPEVLGADEPPAIDRDRELRAGRGAALVGLGALTSGAVAAVMTVVAVLGWFEGTGW